MSMFPAYTLRRYVGNGYSYVPFDCLECAKREYHDLVEAYPESRIELLSYVTIRPGARISKPAIVLSTEVKEQL